VLSRPWSFCLSHPRHLNDPKLKPPVEAGRRKASSVAITQNKGTWVTLWGFPVVLRSPQKRERLPEKPSKGGGGFDRQCSVNQWWGPVGSHRPVQKLREGI